ncbi:MAG: hypothetical protein IJB44_09095, partial [Clostridia bacterium]|nr:hypothetical protein [Clostridia bacterium]
SRSFHNTNYHSIQASESFFENEYLPIFKGRSITKEDFDEIRNAKSPEFTINVIAGYSFSEKYEVGDIIRGQYTEGIQYEHGDEDLSDYILGMYDQDNAAYRVVGFIEKGVTFANASGSIQSTDDFVFVPFIPEIGIFFPEVKEEGEGFVSDFTNWKILIRNGKADEYAEKINEMLDGLFIDKYCDLMDSYGQAYVILDEVVTARKDSFLIIAIVLFMFSVSGIIVSTVNKFKRNTKSYTIHMTVGATNKDIYIFAAVEMLMQILIAFAIIHIPYIFSWVELPIIKFINRNIPYMRSPVMYILLFAFAVIFVAVTVGVTAYCLKKYSIAEAINGKE